MFISTSGLSAPGAYRRLSPGVVAIFLLSGLIPAARAQTLFYDADATINTDISGNDVVIGSVNVNPFTVIIADPAIVTYNYDFGDGLIGAAAYNQSVVNVTGGQVYSLQLFGQSSVNISGGQVSYVSAFDNSAASFSGGTVFQLVAANNSAVSINGGTVYSASFSDTATLGVSSGSVGYLSFSGSNATVSGGAVDAAFADNGSVLNISGGSLGSVYGTAGSILNISGGTGNSAVVDGSGSILNFTGGTYGGIGAGTGASAYVSGGNIANYMIANGPGATLQITGNGLSVDSITSASFFDGVHNYLNSTYAVSGTLADGSLLNTIVYAGTSYVSSSTELDFTGRNVVYAPDLYLVSDANVNAIYDHVVVGKDVTNTINASPTVSFSAGADVGNAAVYNGSVVTVADGIIHGSLDAYDNSVIVGTGGDSGYLRAYNNSQVNLTGGLLGGIETYDNSIVNVSGVSPNGTGIIVNAYGSSQANFSDLTLASIVAQQNSVVTLSNVTVTDQASASDNATVTLHSGFVPFLVSYGGTVNMDGGNVTFLNVNGGTANVSGGAGEYIFTNPGGITNFSGGTFGVVGASGGAVKVSGGNISLSLFADQGGVVEVSGGTALSVFVVSSSSVISITGGQIGGIDSDLTDFNFTGIYVTAGTLDLFGHNLNLFDPMAGSFNFYQGTYYTLTGSLLDGSALDTTFFLADGATANLVNVPEPGAVTFGVMAGLALLGAIWRQRRHQRV